MEPENATVTPITTNSRVLDAVKDLTAENHALRQENLRLRAELDMAARLLATVDRTLQQAQEALPDAGA